MAKDAKTYLAANVLNESKLVSYRMLSRELKIHNNVAKQMLFEFHARQNSKKPGSVHATYLLCGSVRSQRMAVGEEDDEDTPMASSPFMSSPAVNEEEETLAGPSQTVITLVKEENLEEARTRYDEISSIHIYSLGPTSIQNIQLLTECGRQISTSYASEDPLVHNKTYGIIQNSGVRRRTGRRAPPAPAVIEPAKVLPVKPMGRPDSSENAASKQESKASKSAASAASDSRPSSSKGPDKKPTLKREQSDIFKSFAKKPAAKAKREGTESAAATPPAPEPQEDTMKDAALSSSGEDDFFPPPTKQSKAATSNPSRTEREEKLRKMMDDEDNDDDDGELEEEEDDEKDNEDDEANHAPEDSEMVDAPEPPKPKSPSPPPPAVEVSNGRRRGRRKVMKKKTMKDAEGYLVTKEEPVWESFSEEDKPTAPQKPKVQVEGGKGKVATSSAKGQGNLMSFFGKSAKK